MGDEDDRRSRQREPTVRRPAVAPTMSPAGRSQTIPCHAAGQGCDRVAVAAVRGDSAVGLPWHTSVVVCR